VKEQIHVEAVRKNGSPCAIIIDVLSHDPCVLEGTPDEGQSHRSEARDIFDAFESLRELFEGDGVQLLCAGARPDVRPSGMSRSMSGGRKAYVLGSKGQGSINDLVDIFEYADRDVVGTVREQREFYATWLASRKG
jgi:hypothetical protein